VATEGRPRAQLSRRRWSTQRQNPETSRRWIHWATWEQCPLAGWADEICTQVYTL